MRYYPLANLTQKLIVLVGVIGSFIPNTQAVNLTTTDLRSPYRSTLPLHIDSLPASNLAGLNDTVTKASYPSTEPDSAIQTQRGFLNLPESLSNRSIFELIGADERIRQLSWRFNPKYFSFEQRSIDTSLWMIHLDYPQSKKFEPFTFLGNIGSPSQYDHFFTRDNSNPFLFSRNYKAYFFTGLDHPQYNVRTPFTILTYSTAGQRRYAEQIFKVFHTQNVNPYFNFGIDFQNLGTKGVYPNQETRCNSYAFYANYFKGNITAQLVWVGNRFRNQENGGMVDSSMLGDPNLEPRLIPFMLSSTSNTQSITRNHNLSANLGYTFLNVRTFRRDTLGNKVQAYTPLLSSRLIVENSAHSRVYMDDAINPVFHRGRQLPYYPNTFINPICTRDSVSLRTLDVVAMLEVAQFLRLPGLPGLRGWVGYQDANYYFFEPSDFTHPKGKQGYGTSHVGLGTFSHSPHFSYQGAFRIFTSGYRAEDMELHANARMSLWKDPEMPQLIGNLAITERTPDVFLNRYFSNHFQWDNSFSKEKRFRLEGVLRADKWWTEIGYNVMHISDYHYFNTEALPSQADNVTVTSAFVQNRVRFFGINFANRVVWQANTNPAVLSLPNLLVFTSLFYEAEIVRNALTGQLGFSMYYRSKFYADAYSAPLGQFYNQRVRELGSYPLVDVFASFKWKRALIFVKYEHVNQGYPSNDYFSAYNYPLNPRVFKYGLSWFFHD